MKNKECSSRINIDQFPVFILCTCLAIGPIAVPLPSFQPIAYTTTTTALLLYFMNNNCINAQVLVTMRRTERNRDEAILQCSQGLNSNHMNAAMAWHGNIFLR